LPDREAAGVGEFTLDLRRRRLDRRHRIRVGNEVAHSGPGGGEGHAAIDLAPGEGRRKGIADGGLDRPELFRDAGLEFEITMVDGLQLDREAAFRALANCGRDSRHAGDHWRRCRLYKAGRCGTIGNENYIGTPRSPMPQQANQALPAGYVLNGYRIEDPSYS